MILFFLSISDCQEASNTQAKTFFRHNVYPFIDRTNDDFLESPMLHLAKDNMKNMKFRGGSILPEKHTLTPVATLDEVIQPILKAKTEKKILRVAGAQHSVNNAIFPDDGVTLLLTADLRKVEKLYVQKERHKKWLYCRIGGGFYLGKDPIDPNSNLKN